MFWILWADWWNSAAKPLLAILAADLSLEPSYNNMVIGNIQAPEPIHVSRLTSGTGMPKPPHEGYELVERDVKEGIEELKDIIIFFEKRIELEDVYSQNYEEFVSLLPDRFKDTGVIWQSIQRAMKQSIIHQKKYLEQTRGLLTGLKECLQFQKRYCPWDWMWNARKFWRVQKTLQWTPRDQI